MTWPISTFPPPRSSFWSRTISTSTPRRHSTRPFRPPKPGGWRFGRVSRRDCTSGFPQNSARNSRFTLLPSGKHAGNTELPLYEQSAPFDRNDLNQSASLYLRTPIALVLSQTHTCRAGGYSSGDQPNQSKLVELLWSLYPVSLHVCVCEVV